jgi:hypothetical protein
MDDNDFNENNNSQEYNHLDKCPSNEKLPEDFELTLNKSANSNLDPMDTPIQQQMVEDEMQEDTPSEFKEFKEVDERLEQSNSL